MPNITYTILINGSPAPPDVLERLTDVQVETIADMADVFRMTFAIGMSDRQDWTTLEDEHFEPLTPVEIRIQVGSGKSEPLVSGYVTSQRVEFSSEPGESSLEIVGMDETVMMNLEEKIAEWPDMADSDIATSIFGGYGYLPDVDPTQPTRSELDVKTIQRGTDIQFLRRLAQRNGFECYVEKDPLTEQLVGHFHPPRLQARPQGVLSVSFGESTNVTSFSVHYDMLHPTTARAGGIDIGSKSLQSSQVQSVSSISLGKEDLLGRLSAKPVILSSKTGLNDTGELQILCQAVVDHSAWAIVAEGEVNTAVYEGVLRAHKTVNVRGVGAMFNGTYYVNRVLYVFSGGDCHQRFGLIRNAVGETGAERYTDLGIG